MSKHYKWFSGNTEWDTLEDPPFELCGSDSSQIYCIVCDNDLIIEFHNPTWIFYRYNDTSGAWSMVSHTDTETKSLSMLNYRGCILGISLPSSVMKVVYAKDESLEVRTEVTELCNVMDIDYSEYVYYPCLDYKNRVCMCFEDKVVIFDIEKFFRNDRFVSLPDVTFYTDPDKSKMIVYNNKISVLDLYNLKLHTLFDMTDTRWESESITSDYFGSENGDNLGIPVVYNGIIYIFGVDSIYRLIGTEIVRIEGLPYRLNLSGANIVSYSDGIHILGDGNVKSNTNKNTRKQLLWDGTKLIDLNKLPFEISDNNEFNDVQGSSFVYKGKLHIVNNKNLHYYFDNDSWVKDTDIVNCDDEGKLCSFIPLGDTLIMIDANGYYYYVLPDGSKKKISVNIQGYVPCESRNFVVYNRNIYYISNSIENNFKRVSISPDFSCVYNNTSEEIRTFYKLIGKYDPYK
jgi:hypothetical protein